MQIYQIQITASYLELQNKYTESINIYRSMKKIYREYKRIQKYKNIQRVLKHTEVQEYTQSINI